MTRVLCMLAAAVSVALCGAAHGADAGGDGTMAISVGTFQQEIRNFHKTENGLNDNDVLSIAVTGDGCVWAGTSKGLCRFQDGAWSEVAELTGAPVPLLAARGENLVAVFQGALYMVRPQVQRLASLPATASAGDQVNSLAFAGGTLLGTKEGLYRLAVNRFEPYQFQGCAVRQIAVGPSEEIAVACEDGLWYSIDGQNWQQLFPSDGKRSWAPKDVRGVAFDSKGRLWFASPQGAGCLGDGWSLYAGEDGLPYDDFTGMAAGLDGTVWFGTKIGAVRYDGSHWAYRQGLRWLPDDEVRGLVVDADGAAWFATRAGVGCITSKSMTLAEKAKFYEDEIDLYHRRTEFGYVLEVTTEKPGDKSKVHIGDSDNDGLWTSMYGAGECFAYAATGDPKAKARAKQAFEALRQLYVVTQGGSQPSQPGFIARTILPTSGWNPNETEYTAEKDRQTQQHDRKWKVLYPRWPTSADGKWYYKCDTSSDELDGHYFFYALYYDLVADTEEEKARVREVVGGLTDHLVRNDFCLVDWDGEPTRWAIFGPKHINHDTDWWEERGLNSLSMLSYLATAEHVTGDSKFRDAANVLITDHAYAQNTLVPKLTTGYGGGNQSDDEMAFMSYYNLLRYEKDPALRNTYCFSLARYWMLEAPEMNPFFNFCYASLNTGESFTNAFGEIGLSPGGDWLDDSIETLKRFPLDRFDWRHSNSHRTDIIPLASHTREDGAPRKGYRHNGKVVPVDETYFNHWNADLWDLETGGSGSGLGDGTVFLLPYYMGLYHGYIVEEKAAVQPETQQ